MQYKGPQDTRGELFAHEDIVLTLEWKTDGRMEKYMGEETNASPVPRLVLGVAGLLWFP